MSKCIFTQVKDNLWVKNFLRVSKIDRIVTVPKAIQTTEPIPNQRKENG